MASIDLKRVYKEHYTAKADPSLVDVPKRPHLMIDGEGSPGASQVYLDAVGALYPIAYGIRKAIKDATGDAYTVMPLQGLWWADDMDVYISGERDAWKWTLMILQPEIVDAELAAAQIESVTAKKKLASGHLVRFEPFGDGKAAQLLHLGPYADEGPNIQRLHAYIAASGHKLSGKHHEIYLSDPRRVAPEKIRTIIRQPFS
ncbi:MAG: hypothetical protein HKN91_07270 [Acidimicrobiia bacterium]|nr:hypothetical protein [Acidimicrobiia bacterium]